MCKSDAAWEEKTLKAGLAWIILDPSNSLEARGMQVHHNVNSPLVAEALALREALQSAISMNVTHLRMFSDNQTLIRAINDKLFEKEIYGILKDIEASSSLFVNLSFSYFPWVECLSQIHSQKPKSCNGPAHGLNSIFISNAISLTKKKLFKKKEVIFSFILFYGRSINKIYKLYVKFMDVTQKNEKQSIDFIIYFK